MTEACRIRKNILLYKLKHGLNDSTISSVRDLNHLRSKSNVLKQQISALEEQYEEHDYVVRQKSKIKVGVDLKDVLIQILISSIKLLVQRLKDIKSKCSMTSTRKDFLKLKHSETSKQLKDCGDMRRVCKHLMPNTSTDLNQQRLRENLNIVTDLRRSATDKKQVNLVYRV